MVYKPVNLRSMYTRNRGEVLDNIMGYTIMVKTFMELLQANSGEFVSNLQDVRGS